MNLERLFGLNKKNPENNLIFSEKNENPQKLSIFSQMDETNKIIEEIDIGSIGSIEHALGKLNLVLEKTQQLFLKKFIFNKIKDLENFKNDVIKHKDVFNKKTFDKHGRSEKYTEIQEMFKLIFKNERSVNTRFLAKNTVGYTEGDSLYYSTDKNVLRNVADSHKKYSEIFSEGRISSNSSINDIKSLEKETEDILKPEKRYYTKVDSNSFKLLNVKNEDELIKHYISFLYSGVMNELCEDLNFKREKSTLEEQLYFLNFLNTNPEFYDKIKNFSLKYSNDGIKTFLSIEKGGKEMGNKILHLSENLPENEAKEVFAGYSNLIDNANILGEKISSRIGFLNKDKISEGVDINKLPNELIDSLMLRAKDVLVGADKVLENQLAGAVEKLNTKDVTDAVLGINTLVSMLSNIDGGSEYSYKKLESKGNKPGEYLTKYLVIDSSGIEYGLKIFIRPKAEKDAQARVNIELSFDTEKPNERLQKAFFNETINHKENKTSACSVLRIGIDRDDFNYTGAVSLDIGRSERTTERYTRTGDVLGKLLSMTSTEGHHETSAFSKEFADEKVFESITTMLAGYFANQETS